MRVPKKIIYFIATFIINATNFYAQVDPPPGPGDVGGSPAPPPPGLLPINNEIWILWIGGGLIASYFIFKKHINKKAPIEQ